MLTLKRRKKIASVEQCLDWLLRAWYFYVLATSL